MVNSFIEEHLKKMKAYDKQKNIVKVTKPYIFFVTFTIFILMYIVFLYSLLTNIKNDYLLIYYICVVFLGILSIITLYIHRSMNIHFLNGKKKYFSEYYSTNLKISIENKSIRTIDDECIERKIDDSVILKDKKIIKNVASFVIMNDKEFKELLTIVSNSATRNKHTFKANFSILAVLLTFGIALLNISFTQPSDQSLNLIKPLVYKLDDEVKKISIGNIDTIQNDIVKVEEKLYDVKTEPYTLINSSLNDLQNRVKNFSTEDNVSKQFSEIKDKNKVLKERLDKIKEEKNTKIHFLIYYSSVVYIFYLFLVFIASRIENFLNRDSRNQQLLADILNESYLLKINQNEKNNF